MSDDAVMRGTTKRQIRGSTLFVFGRFISLFLNFVVQVLTAQYLTTTEYGAFAYALSVVALGETLVTLGVDRAVPRFAPVFEEEGQWAKLGGTLVFVLGVIGGLGLGLVLLVLGLGDALVGTVIDDPTAASLVAILIVLAPIQALDGVLMNLFATFASPRAIFVRKYLLAPGLRLAVVGLLVATSQGVEFLALGYVATGLFAVVVYGVILVRVLAARGVLARVRAVRPEIPGRLILAYTIPLLSTDLVYLGLNTADALVLGAIHGVDAVAALRVVGPLAALNQVIAASFALLFTPAAARLRARGDREGMDELYWQTTAWLAVLSFPVFAVTFALADQLTPLLYGDRYAGSAIILSVLAVGRAVDAAFGLNGLTLRVWGDVRLVVLANLLAVALDAVLLVTLVPPLGALGAAIATSASLVGFNVIRQVLLWRGTGLRAFDPRQMVIYVAIGAAVGLLVAVETAVRPPLPVGVALAGLLFLAVFAVARERLRLAETFPELGRVPLLRRLVGGAARSGAEGAGPGSNDVVPRGTGDVEGRDGGSGRDA